MKKRYTLNIYDSGHVFTFKGKRVRTPVEFKNITDEEVKLLKTQARRNAVDFSVEQEKWIGE